MRKLLIVSNKIIQNHKQFHDKKKGSKNRMNPKENMLVGVIVIIYLYNCNSPYAHL